MTLLEEYIRLSLTEKIRRRRDPKTGKPLNAFNWEIFKTMKSPNARILYARRFLQPFGSGSSRAVFLLSSKKVLKIAKNDAGIEQNRAETGIAHDPDIIPIFARVLDYDKKLTWIVSELVRELSGEDEFERLAGAPWQVFVQTIAPGADEEVQQMSDEDFLKLLAAPEREANIDKYPIIAAALEVINNYDLGEGDICDLSHWGKTADGRAVLLDYGLTMSIHDKFYENV